MNITVKAIVLKVKKLGESDRLCTLLTDKCGIIRAYAKGAANIKNRNFAATAQFVCGSFTLFYRRDRYCIDESSYDELFVRLRSDIDKLSLGQYICELAAELAPEESAANDYLFLVKLALYVLATDRHPRKIIKAGTEMRLLALSGYMPDLVMCGGCGAYEDDEMYFNPQSGTIRCAECGPSGPAILMKRSAVAALRQTIYADLNMTFSFLLEPESLEQFCEASERYLIEQTGRTFATLDFLRTLRTNVNALGTAERHDEYNMAGSPAERNINESE